MIVVTNKFEEQYSLVVSTNKQTKSDNTTKPVKEPPTAEKEKRITLGNNCSVIHVVVFYHLQ